MQKSTAQTNSLKPDAGAIAAHIRDGGGISLAEYMRRAASAYYAGATPFGRTGDFTTAPEISQLFGEMIGLWCADLWMQAGKPARVMLAELGPGRGTLMADILRTARNWPEFHAALSVHLVEASPQLRAVQATALGDAVCAWHDDVAGLPRGDFSLILANEFFDALPIRQFIRRGGVWRERFVVWDAAEEALAFDCRAAPDTAAYIPAHLSEAPEGSIFEASPQSTAIAAQMAAHIAESGGACLAIDYGHIKTAAGDTLQAVSKHQYADVLENPGGQDITAHVDFDALRLAAAGQTEVFPALTQGQFLNALGIGMRAQKLADQASTQQQAQIPLDVHRLTAPSAMGDLFKVLCWVQKGSGLIPAGFGKGEG
ncbi:MAG: SAM-dependent methyltransferase [Alphaproteobacteria bacterium]|nr:SAM-dependent methyltransferase [Alphaproteobacteria bacterium]